MTDVHLLQLPVQVWARSQEQSEALQREFALVADDPAGVPARLLDLINAVRTQYGDSGDEQEDQLLDAAERGVEVIADFTYPDVPAGAGPAVRDIGRMLDEADAYCQDGEHLLTLAPDEELVRFRWWYLDQFTEQLAGVAPVAWPDYVLRPAPR